MQDAYPGDLFPSIVHSTLTPLSISKGVYSQGNYTANSLTSLASTSPNCPLLLLNRSSGTSTASHTSFASFAGPSHMQMVVDTPDRTLIEELDEHFDLGSLAVSFGSQSLWAYLKAAQFPRIEKCPVLIHITGDGQTMLQALMSMPRSHGAWKEKAIDFDYRRPTEADITLIAFKTFYMVHHLLAERRIAGPQLINTFAETCA